MAADEKTSRTVDEMRDIIKGVLELGPRRMACSRRERRAQELLQARFQDKGLQTELRPFCTNDSLYAVMALHCAVGLAGTAALAMAHPWWAFALHALAAISYTGDSWKRFHILRRAFPCKPSQNLLATMPTKGTPKLRIALVAHADAAFTGWLFHPAAIRRAAFGPHPPGLGVLRKSMRAIVLALTLLAALEAVLAIAGASINFGVLAIAGVLTLPALIGFVLNAQVVLRDEVVPGANDNLSGCAALVTLADRLRGGVPDNVEIVMVVTGAEEAGTCGAQALAREALEEWSTVDTVVVGVDSITNGAMYYLLDGEVIPLPAPHWLQQVAEETATSDERFPAVEGYDIPSGASDAAPFLARGFDAIALGCVDPEIGAPRHYHRPTDTLENLDWDQAARSVDFVEAFVHNIIRTRG